jgi:hypothetical protein
LGGESKMALTMCKSMKEGRGHETLDSMFASRYVQCELPK